MHKVTRQWVQGLDAMFSPLKDEGQALHMQAYMRNQFSFYGIQSKIRRMSLKDYLNTASPLNAEQQKEVIKLLWAFEQREMQYSAQELCKSWKCYNDPLAMELFQQMITQCSWWDTVDFIASTLVGAHLQSFPESIKRIEQWNRNSNIWLIRTSLLYQLKYKARTDLERLESFITPHSAHKDFFIRKAIGWALRQASKHQPEGVAAILSRHNLATLSVKEASKYL